MRNICAHYTEKCKHKMHTKETVRKLRYRFTNPATGRKYTNRVMGAIIGVDGSVYSRKERGLINFRKEEIDLVVEWFYKRHPASAVDSEGGDPGGAEYRTGRDSMRYRLEAALDDVRIVYESRDRKAIELVEWGLSALKRQLPGTNDYNKKIEALEDKINKLQDELNFRQGATATAPEGKNG